MTLLRKGTREKARKLLNTAAPNKMANIMAVEVAVSNIAFIKPSLSNSPLTNA